MKFTIDIDKNFVIPDKRFNNYDYIDKRVNNALKNDQGSLRTALKYLYFFDGPINLPADRKKIAEKYQKALNLPNITFGYRQAAQPDRGWTPSQDYVLEDLFAMAQFDCLVRSSSGYSGLASIIGNHKIVIVPKRAGWFDDVFRVDSVWIVERHAGGSMTKTGWEAEVAS